MGSGRKHTLHAIAGKSFPAKVDRLHSSHGQTQVSPTASAMAV